MTDQLGTPWHAGDELQILHAVRLAGFADTDAIADRVGRADESFHDWLGSLERRHLIECMAFADSDGWIITDAGRARDAELLQLERQARDSLPVLHTTLDEFESGINAHLVRVITEWQLRSPTGHAAESGGIVGELTELGRALSELMRDLTGRVPRFSRYPRQFSAAVERARAGDTRWIAGVGLLSCHVVWAELHQDLLSSAGRERSTTAGADQS